MAVSAFAGKPAVQFGPDGVSVLNVRPGTKIAWISLTRVREAHHTTLRIDRGIEVAQPSRKAAIARPGADRSRALWVVAAIEEDVAGNAIAPGYSISPSPIDITAPVSSATIRVVSSEVELLYVRPQGGAWFISATDGGIGDGDAVQDTVITISLESLVQTQGNPQPPSTTAAGDTILMIDPRSNRTTVVRVGQ
jgi:hypothetical protein